MLRMCLAFVGSCAAVLLGAMACQSAEPIHPSLFRDPAATIQWTSPTAFVIGSSFRPDEPAVFEEIDAATGQRRPIDPPPVVEQPRKPRGRPGDSESAAPLPEAAASLAGPPRWSPDGSHVVVWEVSPAQEHPVHLVESAPDDRVEPRLQTLDYLKPGDRIEQRWPRLFTNDGAEIPISR